MFHSLLGAIKEIAVFMVICEALLHLTPTKNFEKYIKPIIAFMILSKIMISILSFNTSDLKITMEDAMTRYEKQLQGIEITESDKQYIDVSKQLRGKLNNDLINEYEIEKAIIRQENKDDGEGKNTLFVTLQRKDNKIVIEDVNLEKDTSQEVEGVKQIIASSLGADKENIEVIIE